VTLRRSCLVANHRSSRAWAELWIPTGFMRRAIFVEKTAEGPLAAAGSVGREVGQSLCPPGIDVALGGVGGAVLNLFALDQR
jgi:hypothetical protein